MRKDRKRATIIVDHGGRHSSGLWIGILLAALILALLLLIFGITGLFTPNSPSIPSGL